MTVAPAATKETLEQELAETKAALLELRTAVGKEMGQLVELADEGLDDDSVFFAMRRLILLLPEGMRPCDPANMICEPNVAQ